jgi:CHAT domain-containing protein
MKDRRSSSSTLMELFWFDDVLWVFVLRSDLTTPHVESKPLHSDETRQIIDELLHVLFQPNAIYSSSGWNRLSELICQPLQQHLGNSDRVIMIPYGLFHFLPLHLLILDGAPLIESHAVAYAPSTSVLQYCQQKNPKRINRNFHPQTLAAIGLDFENESEIVAKYFESADVLSHRRTKITKELIVARCSAKDVIHFSAHGEFTPGDPENSGLVLPMSEEKSKSKYLTLREVYDMRLDSYLVTLGACSSGIGDYVSGDEVIGITRGFLYAGTPSVLASLWPVRNEPTLLLMDKFYTHLQQNDLDKADALRQAQLEVREHFASPADWAGFTLIGDWL